MTHRLLVAALGMIVAASPVSAALPGPLLASAPTGDPSTRYCLRVEPVTGSRIETIRCETRDGWAQLEVDVDAEWATEGVRTVA